MMAHPESTEESGPGVITFYRALLSSRLHCCKAQFSQNGMLRTKLGPCSYFVSGQWPCGTGVSPSGYDAVGSEAKNRSQLLGSA